MTMFLKKLRLALAFASRDISKSRGVLFLTVASLGLAYSVVFISGGVLSGFSEALKSGSINSNGNITVYLKNDAPEGDIRRYEEMLDSIEGVAGASSRRHAGLNVFVDGKFRGSAGYASLGIDPEREKSATRVANYVISGRFLDSNDANKVVIGETFADSLEGKLYDGKSINVGKKITYMGPLGKKKEFTIVGIIDAKYYKPNWSSYFLKEDAEYLDDSERGEEIAVRVLDESKIEEIKRSISEKNPDLLLASWKEREGYVGNLILAIGYITGNIIRLLILTSFILTSVFIFINVLQRQRQIGILKSMGASNNFVGFIYITEAIIFSILSFCLGSLVFFLAYVATDAMPIPSLVGDIKVVPNIANVLYSFLALAVASMIGSFLPIYFAIRVQIADVIRNST